MLDVYRRWTGGQDIEKRVVVLGKKGEKRLMYTGGGQEDKTMRKEL